MSKRSTKSSILDIIDFSTPEAKWLDKMPSPDSVNYWHITNRIKIKQRIIPKHRSKIVTAGYALGGEYEKWRQIALYFLGCEVLYSSLYCGICAKFLSQCESDLCCDCKNIVRPMKKHVVGEVELIIPTRTQALTILTSKNHAVFCFEIKPQGDHKSARSQFDYRVVVMCKSITESKWKNIDSKEPVHLDITGINVEHCHNPHSPCKCKKLSREIFEMNLANYTLFAYAAAAFNLPIDVIGVVASLM